MSDQDGADAEPLFRVTRGEPTAEELAAVVVAVLASRPGHQPPPSAGTGWGAYWRGLRTPPGPGPDGWRASARSW